MTRTASGPSAACVYHTLKPTCKLLTSTCTLVFTPAKSSTSPRSPAALPQDQHGGQLTSERLPSNCKIDTMLTNIIDMKRSLRLVRDSIQRTERAGEKPRLLACVRRRLFLGPSLTASMREQRKLEIIDIDAEETQYVRSYYITLNSVSMNSQIIHRLPFHSWPL